jgi:hypothetical protein
MKASWTRSLLFWGTVAAGLGACDPGPEGLGPIERRPAALNGNLTFGHGCSNDMALLIQDAMDSVIAPFVLADDSLLRQCLQDNFLSGGVTFQQEISYPEWILRRLKENMITTVECADLAGGGAGQAQLGIAHEFITLDRGFMADLVETHGWEGARLRLAGIMLHEISHNKGYAHPVQDSALFANDNYHSVPVALYSCLTDIGEDGLIGDHNKRRSQLPQEATLAPVGLEGGQPLFAGSAHCSGADFVTGVRGRSQGSINALGLRCTPPEGSPHNFKGPFGGSAGAAFDLGCLSGELAVGLHGTADPFINSVGMVCQSRAGVQQGSTSGRFFDPTVGGTAGLPWSRTCPKFQALKAVRMRTATLVDRIELVCFDTGITPISHDLTFMSAFGGGGNSRSVTYFEQCPTRAVMNGVETNSGWAIDRLSGSCESVFRARGGALTKGGIFGPVPGHGGAFGLWTNSTKCDQVPGTSNSALIGLRLSHNGKAITSVANICTDDMRSWGNGTNVAARRVVGQTGAVNGTPMDVVCPAGKFPVGWKLKAGDSGGPVLVENVQLACRAL